MNTVFTFPATLILKILQILAQEGACLHENRKDLHRMKQKCAVITGASRGIGAAAAERFAAGGWNLALSCVRSSDRLEELAGRLILRNPEVVVVTDEVGCGIVPLEPFERDWREQTGRICTRLAAASRKVYRVILGIGKEIKG